MLDSLIYFLAAVVLIVSFFKNDATFPAVVLCLSFIVNELIFIEQVTWKNLETWVIFHAIKDGIILLVLISRRNSQEVLLGSLFAFSCLYHQVMLCEIQNYILTLKHFRPTFMMFLTAMQLASIITLIIAGSGSNGGRRYKHPIHHPDYRPNNFFCHASYRAEK